MLDAHAPIRPYARPTMMPLSRLVIAAVAVVVAACLTQAASGAVINYWRFETQSGSAVTDGQTISIVDDVVGSSPLSQPAGSTGTSFVANNAFPDPVPATGDANGFAGSFPGGDASEQGVENASLSLGGDTTYTFEMFFRKESGSLMMLARLGDRRRVIINGGSSSKVRYTVTGASDTTSSSAVITSNVTHHLAIVRDGNRDRLYIDGVEILDVGNGNLPNGNGIFLGNSNARPSVDNFDGLIDEVRISNEALSPGEFLRVPEPGSLLLFGAGTAVLLLRRRDG